MMWNLFIIYLFFGVIYGLYDWCMYSRKKYEDAERMGTANSSMFGMYWICMLLFWPIFFIQEFFKKL